MTRKELTYILVAYKIENGFIRDMKMLEYENSWYKERLEFLKDETSRYDNLKQQGYILDIFKKEDAE